MKNTNYNHMRDSRLRRNDNVQSLKDLHKKFIQLGRERNQLTYQMLALLPEINEKKIYFKHGCSSIVEYAGKFGGLSKSVVIKTLKVHEDVKDKPYLKAAIAKIGIHKVGLVSKVSTKENEQALAETIENTSTEGVQMLSKELRNSECKKEEYGKISGQLQLSSDNDVSVRGSKRLMDGQQIQPKFCQAAPVKMNIELDKELQFQFLKLKKEFGKDLSNREALRKMLSKLENLQEGCTKVGNKFQRSSKQQNQNRKEVNSFTQQTSQNVTNFCAEIRDKSVEKMPRNNSPKKSAQQNQGSQTETVKNTTSRYIPINIKRAALAKTQGRCAYPGCNKPADIFHHRQRFSETKNHSSIIPLCKCHHEFAHNGLIINEHLDPENWQLAIARTSAQEIWEQGDCQVKKRDDSRIKVQSPQKSYADTFYQLYAQRAL